MNETETDLKRAHLYINGSVQGVGFRHFVKANARELGIFGWVKNLSDGRVEAVLEGSEDQINSMVDRCKKGPGSAQVNNVDFEWNKNPEKFDSFKVKRY